MMSDDKREPLIEIVDGYSHPDDISYRYLSPLQLGTTIYLLTQHSTFFNCHIMRMLRRPIILPLLLLCRIATGNASSLTAVFSPISLVKNLAKGSFLKCAADLTGGLVSAKLSRYIESQYMKSLGNKLILCYLPCIALSVKAP
jgi:hypothetical protein